MPKRGSTEVVSSFSVIEISAERPALRCPESPVMVKSLLCKGSDAPSLHACRHYGYPVNASCWVRHITTNLLKALPPKELTSTGDIVFTFKTILCRIVTAIFRKWSSGNT